MKRLALVLATVLFPPGSAFAAQCEPTGAARSELRAVLDAVNAHRKSEGRKPLERDARIDKAAQGQACDMAARGKLTHDGNGGPKRRMKKDGCNARLTGEAIAMGQRNAGEVVASWMQSPPHRKILLLPNARVAGLGLAPGGKDGRPYWVLDVADGC
ncbi:CAP domain-containing protein [Defluviimonas sp. WL0002]|uniref:CAP domain-containing protein n=1 Tax=Albidovulum marisflavi TaxID=2984159 RepID=A0ABT2ZBB3_9RHOB|nr:CAP domain-containing protein [Defluviimonas sp. WL0002]MCV2868081.1 CAP domain-containing protein [Defluviimonas sp. WL0002]